MDHQEAIMNHQEAIMGHQEAIMDHQEAIMDQDVKRPWMDQTLSSLLWQNQSAGFELNSKRAL